MQLRDVTETTGIQFKHSDGSTGKRFVVEPVASGLATLDYDGDGLIDIYFLTGGPLEGQKVANPPTNALYRNLGNFRFEDVTQKAGVGKPGYAMGVAVGDYDNDRRPDIYVSNYGPNVLYHNAGNGTFVDATPTAGVGPQDKTAVGAGTAFLDMDGDGDLDLYVGNYLTFAYETHPHRTFMGVHVYPGPLEFTPVPDTLYRNNGNGTFTDVSQESGIGPLAATAMGMVCADYNNDGHTDILVGNDVMPNFLWQNDGKGKFQEVALFAGVAYDTSGAAHSNMGVDCGDYDNDGEFDFLITSFHRELVALYRNLGGGEFEDVARATGAGDGSFNQVKWGCGFVDFDNDGYRDIFIACGNLYDNVEEFDRTTSYRAKHAPAKPGKRPLCQHHRRVWCRITAQECWPRNRVR